MHPLPVPKQWGWADYVDDPELNSIPITTNFTSICCVSKEKMGKNDLYDEPAGPMQIHGIASLPKPR